MDEQGYSETIRFGVNSDTSKSDLRRYKLIKSEAQLARNASSYIALIRWDNRDSFRVAVFFLKTPRLTLRINSGCAARKALFAASLSLSSIAVSTFLRNVRTRFRRLAFITDFRPSRLTRFLADVVFAMDFPLKRPTVVGHILPLVKELELI